MPAPSKRRGSPSSTSVPAALGLAGWLQHHSWIPPGPSSLPEQPGGRTRSRILVLKRRAQTAGSAAARFRKRRDTSRQTGNGTQARRRILLSARARGSAAPAQGRSLGCSHLQQETQHQPQQAAVWGSGTRCERSSEGSLLQSQARPAAAVHQDEAVMDDAAAQCLPRRHGEPAAVEDHGHNGPVELLGAWRLHGVRALQAGAEEHRQPQQRDADSHAVGPGQGKEGDSEDTGGR